MSSDFWDVIILHDSLTCHCSSWMWSNCWMNWYIGIRLGCDPTLGFLGMFSISGIWSYYDSVIYHNTSGMWLCCSIRWYVSTHVRCDPTVCFIGMAIHFCEIHWYITAFLGCDPTMWFTGMVIHFYNTTQHCISEDSSIHSCHRGNFKSHLPWRFF